MRDCEKINTDNCDKKCGTVEVLKNVSSLIKKNTHTQTCSMQENRVEKPNIN